MTQLILEGETNLDYNDHNLDENRLMCVKRSCKSVRETTTQHKVRARALTNNSQKKMIYDIIFPTLKCGK